jgi:deoxyribodipyrimidine photo-lyase
MKKSCIVWFNQDLRTSDHAPLQAAVKLGYDVIPLYIHSTDPDPWPMGSASRWWLHHSLIQLSSKFLQKGAPLIIRQGRVIHVLKEIFKATGASALFFHHRVEPFARQVEKDLEGLGCQLHGFFDQLLFTPGTVLNGKSEPYRVYTPFYNACLKMPSPRLPIAEPKDLPGASKTIDSMRVEDLDLLPSIPWDNEFSLLSTPGEEGARLRLKQFLSKGIVDYGKQRDFPSIDGTSLLSAHLHFGEISVFQMWQAILKSVGEVGRPYMRQLLWREFAHHMLYYFPHTDRAPLRDEFIDFPWKTDKKHLSLWQKGQTGYPIVDAGMRQLRRLGWMHNRLRMIVGSFLVKDLLIPWQEGARWFWDTLIDADLANNSFGWQWVSGCGADAAPYFRIFNPVTQAEKFDPEGIYVRAFVPELKNLPNEWIHKPWQAPESILRSAGVVLGKNYPYPIVDHEKARKLALESFQHLSKK